jgi:predicted DNA-binding protein
MEQTSFELTPKQKGILATLSRETGKPVPTLLDEALDVLQEHERLGHAKDETDGNREAIAPGAPPQEAAKPIWEIFEEASRDIPDEVLARLPTDLAAQVDHYVYGLPKR